MKTRGILFALLIFLSAWTVRADAPTSSIRHWYTVVITKGTQTESFTGSSPLASGDFSQLVTGDALPVRLENIRSFYKFPNQEGWREDHRISALYIVPRQIIYFYELAEEPKLMEN